MESQLMDLAALLRRAAADIKEAAYRAADLADLAAELGETARQHVEAHVGPDDWRNAKPPRGTNPTSGAPAAARNGQHDANTQKPLDLAADYSKPRPASPMKLKQLRGELVSVQGGDGAIRFVPAIDACSRAGITPSGALYRINSLGWSVQEACTRTSRRPKRETPKPVQHVNRFRVTGERPEQVVEKV